MEKRRRKNRQKQIDKVLFAEIKQCNRPECGKMFIPKTANQINCSPHCSTEAFKARYRKAA